MLPRETPGDYCEHREKHGNTLRAYNSEFSVYIKVTTAIKALPILHTPKVRIICHPENADKIAT
jgi:hypothetical protein